MKLFQRPVAPRCCLPGTTAIAAGCRGGRWRASAPIPIACGCRKSCCSRPASKRSDRISRNFWRAGRMSRRSAARSLDDVLRMWAGLGYYSRARNLHACAVAVLRDHGGAFPDTEEGLRSLPGIGPYTAAAIAAIAFGRRTMPVDGNIERVVSRLFAVEAAAAAGQAADPATGGDAARRVRTGDEKSRAGDSAQALMDLGSSICTPKKPACALCPLNDDCAARARGDQETFSAQGAEEDRGAAPGRGLRRHARRSAPGAHPPRKRPARRHDRSAGFGMARGAGRQRGAAAGARVERHRALASQGRRRHARVHAFSAGTGGLHRQRCRRAPARPRACAGCRLRRSATKRCPTSCAR